MMKGLCVQHWHVGASLAISCCAAFQVARLTSFFLSNSNTESFPLLFHSHCPVWSSGFLFMTNPLRVGPHPPLYILYVYPPLFLCHPPAYLCLSSFMSSLLQRSPTHLCWHYSHHAVAVPRWTKGWIWFPAVQELHVSRFCQKSLIRSTRFFLCLRLW